MNLRLGVDVACRAARQASCTDDTGKFLWAGHRFRTDPGDLDALWAKLPAGAREVTVIMEPTRNAWVPLAAWFRRHGATVVMVPPEQSADLRDYYNKHAKSDRLDSKVLARLPLLHPEGLTAETGIGPGDALKRAVKIRSGLVHRRTTSMQRLDCPRADGPSLGWRDRVGHVQDSIPVAVPLRQPAHRPQLGKRRLTDFLHRSSRGAWAEERATEIIAAATTTIELWGDEFDFGELAADIATEARLALSLCEEISMMDKRIGALYAKADPAGIVRSAPGVGVVGAQRIHGRLGDAKRFRNLAGVRSFSGLVPRRDDSGHTATAGGPTKAGDACLSEALFTSADHARKIDPRLAQRYHRLMTVEGKHHTSALCHIATVLLTRIAACLRADQPYQLRDIDGTPITETEGRVIVADRYTVPKATRTARRAATTTSRQPRRNERAEKGVAERSEAPPVPTPA